MDNVSVIFMRKILLLFSFIICLFCLTSCGEPKNNQQSSNDKEESNVFYNYIKNKNISVLVPCSYKINVDDYRLPDEANGLLSGYICNVDNNKKEEMICVSINQKLMDNINIGELEIGFINSYGVYYKDSFKSSCEIINHNTALSHIVFYSNGYIGIYHHYGSNFGGGSNYGINLEVLKISDSTLELTNSISYSYAPNFCSLEDKSSGKIYYSYLERDDSEFLDALESASKDLPECFSELIGFSEGDLYIKFTEKITVISEIKMGKTDYSTYYYQDFIDNTNLSKTIGVN